MTHASLASVRLHALRRALRDPALFRLPDRPRLDEARDRAEKAVEWARRTGVARIHRTFPGSYDPRPAA